ncbi:MmgE/PrpD family protein, partial [Bordetella pertussis]|uniref:MmgE/PrpD family protein n=1 Tax=Bordetella pertussis TaxID=520 RepID=UPI00291C5289
MELDTIPAPALDKARACVFNGYGIALGSHPTPFFGVAERAVLAMDGEREDGATLLGSGRRSTVAGAALANAALFHGRAQDGGRLFAVDHGRRPARLAAVRHRRRGGRG